MPYPSFKTCFVTVSCLLALSLTASAETGVYQLWSGPTIPADPGELAEPQGMVHRTVHDARKSDYKLEGKSKTRELGASGKTGPSLEAVPVDIHDRLFPDRWPQARKKSAIGIPQGAPATFQFAVRSMEDGVASLSVDCQAPGKARIHWLQSVHVEGNTQGSKINRPGGKVPDGWLDVLVREAPFDALEVLVESNTMPVTAHQTHGIVVEFSPAPNTKPGKYPGQLRISMNGKESVVEFMFQLYPTVLPETLPLHSEHWLWPQPANLTNGDVPEWWSEQHWQLLESAGRQLRRFGDDTIYTPLINFHAPLIQVTLGNDGVYSFDYSRFDRWAELFFGLGYQQLAGHHVLPMPYAPFYEGVFVTDEAMGKKRQLLKNPRDKKEWLAFLPVFYDSLYEHLKAKGWLEKYIQHQYDEPKDSALYKRLTALARKHLPGVKTADALNNRADRFTPLVDVAVFSLLQLNKHHQVAKKRRAEGKEVWLYHCTSPYPPYPNRHIDRPLVEGRLYPWLAYRLRADGFLYWAANGYRGVNEYKKSIGPFPEPNNNQNPGHPPGDNWFYYRSPAGLRPSIRSVSFREGMIDHALLVRLAKQDPTAADQLVAKIAPSISNYQAEPVFYHRARHTILEAIQELNVPMIGPDHIE